MKKILFILVWLSSFTYTVFAQQVPWINSSGLPWDQNTELWIPSSATDYDNTPFESLADFVIGYFIQFVAVVAVLSLMISGIMLIVSWGEEEKFKKAKTWFTWSLTGVVLALMALYIINFINRLSVWWI